jgi:hypothetical protein
MSSINQVVVSGVLSKKIQKFRTSFGGELTSGYETLFFSFCQNHGIKRELSCPDTPQQNGVAERQIRHLVEVCKSWIDAKN